MHTATLWIGFVQSLAMAFTEVDEAVLYLHMYLQVYLLYAEKKQKKHGVPHWTLGASISVHMESTGACMGT